MPWVTFDINKFEGRVVREDEYPRYFHQEDAEEQKPEEQDDED